MLMPQNAASRAAQTPTPPNVTRAVRVIAVFKLTIGLLLLAVAMGALRLLKGNPAEPVLRWITNLRVDPDSYYMHAVLTKLTHLDSHQLARIGIGSFLYAGLLLTEGAGLWTGQSWGKYLTIIGTGSFIPLEMYEIVKQATSGKAIVLILNLIIVGYLVQQVRRENQPATS